jgi:hypothetical protein
MSSAEAYMLFDHVIIYQRGSDDSTSILIKWYEV